MKVTIHAHAAHGKYDVTTWVYNLPRKVEQMYSDIWFPDLLDSEKWLSSLFNIRLNCNNTRKSNPL
jgi:hypothetical protein